MADNVTVDNGGLTDFVVSSDEAASGQIQRVKLAYSADGVDTHVTADASGVLVNLGANNDVTLTGGTVTIGGGTAFVGGTASVNIVGGTATITGSLSAGTAVIGKAYVANATATADLLTLTSGTALAVGLYDSTGVQVSLSAPLVTTATPALGTAAMDIGDSMATAIVSWANAVTTSAGSGHILRMTVIDDDDLGAHLKVHFFESSVSPAAAGSAHALSDGDADEYIATITTSGETWQDHVNNQTVTVIPSPPIPFKLDSGTTLYGIPVAVGTATHTASGLEIKLHILPD